MKLQICDSCYKKHDKKITQTDHYMSVKGHPELKMAICPSCKAGLPKGVIAYVQFALGLDGIEVTEEQAKSYISH